MNNDAFNPNFEWKKKSFGKKERLSRRIDANKATLTQEKKKNSFTQNQPITAQSAPVFDSRLRKMRKKIKDALDEDEDEDDFFDDMSTLLNPLEQFEDSLLFNGLNETEKNILTQKRTLEQTKMQQDAAKIQALATVNAFAKKAGLKPLSPAAAAENMQGTGWGKETFERAVTHNLAPDIKLGVGKMNEQKVLKLMKGLKRLQKIGGFSAVEGMKVNDIIHITDTRHNDKKVAQLLLKKTGRKLNRTQDKKRIKQREYPKVSFKKLLQNKKENPLTRV